MWILDCQKHGLFLGIFLPSTHPNRPYRLKPALACVGNTGQNCGATVSSFNGGTMSSCLRAWGSTTMGAQGVLAISLIEQVHAVAGRCLHYKILARVANCACKKSKVIDQSIFFYQGWSEGLYSTPAGPLFVTAGTGMVGLPARLGVPPWVDVVTLHAQPQSTKKSKVPAACGLQRLFVPESPPILHIAFDMPV